MRHVPFISITDFTSINQVERMRAALARTGVRHHLGVGAMMSYKTLHGLETKWSGIYPTPEVLQALFVSQDGVMNVLHYADYDGATSLEDLVDAVMLCGGELDAIQFDMVWPAADLLNEFRHTPVGRHLSFIIQVSAQAMKETRNRPSLVAHRLKEYHDFKCLDYALFDMSGGTGTPMDAGMLLPYIGTATGLMPDISVAAAGGLGPSTMHLARPIVCDLMDQGHEVSFCAQSRLRPSGSAMDPISEDMAERYIKEAAALILECE